jgi:hypothetical protein
MDYSSFPFDSHPPDYPPHLPVTDPQKLGCLLLINTLVKDLPNQLVTL